MISRPKRMRVGVVYAVLIVLLAVAVWVDINAGYRHISLETLGQIVLGKGEAGARYTLLHLRLPRVLTSLLVGVGLAVAGCILQGVSRNEMAEPGLLGINAGAGLFVAAFIVFFAKSSVSTSFLLPLLAFAGSVCAALIDYRLALTARGLSPRRLLLIGIAMSTAISSLTTVLMLRMSDSEYAFVQNWLSGNIWGATWPNVLMLLVGLSLLSAFLFLQKPHLERDQFGASDRHRFGGRCIAADGGAFGGRCGDVKSLLCRGWRLELCRAGLPTSCAPPCRAGFPRAVGRDAAHRRAIDDVFRYSLAHVAGAE